MEHFHIIAIAADFLIEVISGMQAVGEYGVSILRAVVQYPLAAVQGSVLEVEVDLCSCRCCGRLLSTNGV